MINKIKLFCLRFRYKYICKKCPHICLWCEYKKDCEIRNYIEY